MTAGGEPVLALDLGGTNVKAAVVTASGELVAGATRPSAEAEGIAPWLASGLAAARAALDAAPVRPRRLGVAVPGAVDSHGCRLVDLVGRLDVGGGVDLRAAFAPLGLADVAADNDARAALAAELRWGAHAGARALVVFTVGTGLGGAASVAGRLPGGERVLAGSQLGHLTVELEGEACVCGNRGCAETVASATALVRSARRAGLEVEDAAGVFAAERAGDDRAATAVDRLVRGLAAAVVNAIHAHQPDAVVLAGGVMAAGERVLEPLRRLVAERAWTIPACRVPVSVSSLGVDLALLGAAATALDAADASGGGREV